MLRREGWPKGERVTLTLQTERGGEEGGGETGKDGNALWPPSRSQTFPLLHAGSPFRDDLPPLILLLFWLFYFDGTVHTNEKYIQDVV